MHIDTHLAAQVIRNYYADFMRLKTAQAPPGDIAYLNLLRNWQPNWKVSIRAKAVTQ